MKRRVWMQLGAVAGAMGFVWFAAVSIQGQTPAAKGKAPAKAATKATAAAKGAANLKTAWGDPNLQGTWFVMYDVPLERPARYEGREFLTDEEIAASDARKGVDPGRNARGAEGTTQDVSGAYNAVFNSILKTGKRTSMIIAPKDGKIPTLPGKGQAFGRGGGGGGRGAVDPSTLNDNPETVAQSPRCLGVPMPFLPLNTAFAQGTVMQLSQSKKAISIYMEDDHAGGGNRIIYLDGRKHLPKNIKSYLGDSIGHWEGNTLVVETTNFDQGFRGSNPDTYKMTERITRTGPTTLIRQITFEDPQTWSQPWTVEIEMGKAEDNRHMIFDSACHEGNYGMVGILAGSRREEAQKGKGK